MSRLPVNTLGAGGVYTAAGVTLTDGQNSMHQMDANGNLKVVEASAQAIGTVGSQVTTISSSTGETTIVTAGSAGIYNDITGFQITNAGASAVTVTIKDSTSGTTRKIFDLAANGGIVVRFDVPLPQGTAANNWTATLSVNTVTVDINVDFIETTEAGQ